MGSGSEARPLLDLAIVHRAGAPAPRRALYQIKALEQLNKVTTVAQRHFEPQKKYGTKRVFWDSSGSIGAGLRS